jgi:hypothetical protein
VLVPPDELRAVAHLAQRMAAGMRDARGSTMRSNSATAPTDSSAPARTPPRAQPGDQRARERGPAA